MESVIKTRETCGCGAVFESNVEITRLAVQEMMHEFRQAHEGCRANSVPRDGRETQELRS